MPILHELLTDVALMVSPLWLIAVLPYLLFAPFSTWSTGILVPITLLTTHLAPKRLRIPPVVSRTAPRALPVLAIASAVVPLVALYALSWRASALFGHWPRYWVDDPKFLDHGDPAFRRLGSWLDYAWAASGWCCYTWAGLMVRLRVRLPKRSLIRNLIIMVIVWELFIIEPGHRFLWWID